MKNNKPADKKHLYLKLLATAVIISGIWITADNLYRYSIGFFAYKTTSAQTEGNLGQSNIQIGDSQDAAARVNTNNTNNEPEPDSTLPLTSDKQKELPLYKVRPETGEEFGELYIPKLDVTLPIYEGTDDEELDKGVGHFAESVLPGENDNCVLSGHRDTVFRKLGEVGEGDSLIVSTPAGEFEYTIYKVRIVDKDDRTVIVPKPRATLTVTTCYPFDYIGSAPKRYILVAYLASETLK